MNILYSAIDQEVPGTKGGSTHVSAVAEALSRLGHDVTALVTRGRDEPAPSRVRWISLPPPFGSSHLRLTRARTVAGIVRDLQPDAIIERYHNFGGEAIVAASRARAIAVLEVNAPVVDHPGSRKALLDRVLIAQPMRRWRDHLCRLADVIVSPSAAILPVTVPRERVQVLEWGADIERFAPASGGTPPFARPEARLVAVFAGAFRSWHGAIHLVEAIKTLRTRGHGDIGAMFVGDGPELPRVKQAAAGIRGILFTGAVPHDRMPSVLASADLGVAPFDLGAHAPLALGFYWSPLKIFEYMASGLPVVAPAVDRLPALVAHGREGFLYDPSVKDALADALVALADPADRQRLGAAARQRAVRDYSWDAHCRALAAAITAAR